MRILPAVLALAAAATPARAEPTASELLVAFERQLKAVYEKAGPAMARVVVSRSDQYPKPATPPDYAGRLGGFDAETFRKSGPDRAGLTRRLDLADLRGVSDHESAAGVVVDPAGLVLTTYHAIEGATKVYAHLPGAKGSYADVYAADARADLAVLKLLTPPEGLKAVKIGDARLHSSPAAQQNVAQGKVVTALAFHPVTRFMPDRPGGLPTTLTNVLFPRNTNAPQSVYQYAPLLEFEARSTPPVSGAAVLNLGGELVGLTSTVAAVSGGDNGRAYALPMDANMRRVVETLARGMEVEYGFLGIMLNQDQTGAGPVVVSSVAPRSPSEGRLFPGDMVVRINDQPTRNYADLLYQVGYTLAGNRLTLVARRTDGKERPVEVTVAKYKHDFPFIAANRPEPVFGLRVDWGSVFAQGGGGGVAPVVPPGVAVREVVPGSPAAEKFKELGDNVRWLVTHVNGTPTPTPAAFYQATRNQPTVRLSLVDTGDTNARRRDVALP